MNGELPPLKDKTILPLLKQVGCVIVVDVTIAELMFTVLTTCTEGPLHPLAVTRISTEPENPFAQVIIPVVAPIEPAKALFKLQLKPVLFVAVVAYVVVVVPLVSWQVG